MVESVDVAAVAGELRIGVGLLIRQLRKLQLDDDLATPELAALARLDRGGSMSAAELARLERISPQSMGATLAKLEARGLVERTADEHDRRRIILSITAAGRSIFVARRSARDVIIERALASELNEHELRQLQAAVPYLERLARRLGA